MEQDLRNLRRLVVELNSTNSSNEKKAILAKHPECKKLLFYTYNPFYQFYMSSDNLKKNSDLVEPVNQLNIFELLDLLWNRDITGHKAISVVNGFVEANKAYTQLIYNIIDRSLKTRADASLINKVFPKLIPEFKVALANKYDDVKDRVDFRKEKWYASRKLDGVRVLAIYHGPGDIEFFSRKGKEFLTLGNVAKEIKKLLPTPKSAGIVFDGEMCIVEGDTEDFTAMIKLIRKKDYTIPNPRYKIFDCLPLEVFEKTSKGTIFSKRLAVLDTLERLGVFDSGILDRVEQRRVRSDKDLEEFVAEANDKRWEGLILRKDDFYKGKRSNDLLKVKKFQDMEFVVADIEVGPFRVIVNGKEVEEVMLSAIKVPYKNNTVSIGSGFSIDQRREFYKDPSKILGKAITCQYFEETKNEHGLYSLRFPVLKHIYNGKRED